MTPTLVIPDGYAVVGITENGWYGDDGGPLSRERIMDMLSNERESEFLRVVPLAWALERRVLSERHAAEHQVLSDRILAAPRVTATVVVALPNGEV